MNKTRSLSAALSFLLAVAIIAPSVFAVGASASALTPQDESQYIEVYLEPTKIGENTYRYEHDGVEIIATFTPDDENSVARVAPGNKSYSFSLKPDEIKQVSQSLDTTNGVTTVYMKVGMTPSGSTLVGYYMTEYTWFKNPVTSSGTISFSIGSSRPIYMALKNQSKYNTIKYTGEYGFSKP